MKKIFVFTSFICSLSSCAQQKNLVIEKAYAFYRVQTPGTIAVDQWGHPKENSTDTVYTVYTEIKTDTIVWKNAWCNNKKFSVSTSRLTGKEATVGESLETAQKIIVSAKAHHTLYQLALNKQPAYSQPPLKIKPGDLLLEGTVNSKRITYIISTKIELVPFFYQ